MKVVLVDAGGPVDGLAWHSWVDHQGRFAMPSVALISLASVVPKDIEVKIIDEKVTELPEKIDADLVAISFKTMYAKRAYALADRLKDQGIKVVLGGVHASLVPDEAAIHADAVAVGEGETIWSQIIEDARLDQLKSIYRAPENPPSLMDLPPQLAELLDHRKYSLHVLQSARGCSFDCEFCPTRAITGPGCRLRNLKTVVAEVEALQKIEQKPIYFCESIFGGGDISYISELSKRLHQLGIRYGVVCDWHMLNEEIVNQLNQNGCGNVAINITGRDEPKEIAALESIYRTGIPIWAYLMFGFEEDTPDVFENAIERVRKYDICCVSPSVLTPFPGTPMGERLAHQNRIFSTDLSKYDHNHVHFEPNLMSADQLKEGFSSFKREMADRLSFELVAQSLSV